MSTINQIADAVVASLNAGSFSLPFTAERRYQPVFELSQLQELRVSVVPKSLTAAVATRSDAFFDCAIDIGIQRKVNADDAPMLDGLMHLVEEVADRLRFHRLETFPGAAAGAGERPDLRPGPPGEGTRVHECIDRHVPGAEVAA